MIAQLRLICYDWRKSKIKLRSNELFEKASTNEISNGRLKMLFEDQKLPHILQASLSSDTHSPDLDTLF